MKKRNRRCGGRFLAAAVGSGLAAAYILAVRPWHLRWGTAPGEDQNALPGDDLVPNPKWQATHAVTIYAPADKVWPWLAQMGQGRGGFYSYDWLENLAGMDIHNARQILPEYQALQPGDVIPFWKGAGVSVQSVEPGRSLVLGGSLVQGGDQAGNMGGSWTFILQPLDATATRLVVRSRVAGFEPEWLSALLYALLLEPAHFIMERKMLLTIKELSEKGTNL